MRKWIEISTVFSVVLVACILAAKLACPPADYTSQKLSVLSEKTKTAKLCPISPGSRVQYKTGSTWTPGEVVAIMGYSVEVRTRNGKTVWRKQGNIRPYEDPDKSQ